MTVEGEGPDEVFGDEPPGRPAPDPDDRLWRHPSEIGRNAAGGASDRAGGEAAGAGADAGQPAVVMGSTTSRGDGRLIAVAALSGIIGALLAVGITVWSGWASDFTGRSSPGPAASGTGVLAGATSLGNGLSAMVAGTAPSVVSLTIRGGGRGG